MEIQRGKPNPSQSAEIAKNDSFGLGNHRPTDLMGILMHRLSQPTEQNRG
jgi:hypothetical protein